MNIDNFFKGAKRSAEDFRSFFENGFDINVKDSDGNTALMYAMQYHSIEHIKSLVYYGLNVCSVNNYGETALLYALNHSGANLIENIQYLLGEGGADVNDKDNNGNTALMLAVKLVGWEKIIDILLFHGADVNVQDNDGNTVLMRVILEGFFDRNDIICIVERLIREGVTVDIGNTYGKTALMCAAGRVHYFEADIFRIRNTPFINELINLLLANGADVNVQDNDGRTALIYAAEAGNESVVKLLLANRADVNVQDNDGRTAWMHANDNNNYEIANILNDAMYLSVSAKR